MFGLVDPAGHLLKANTFGTPLVVGTRAEAATTAAGLALDYLPRVLPITLSYDLSQAV